MNIYNEIDLFAARWLRNLIDAGHLPRGHVSDRSIVKLKPESVQNFAQAHFFAGIGVWSYALRAAGWPDDRPVWTGSCPCQPFSKAGRQKGFDDPRHLWPQWFRLIKECRPSVILGEQVASPDGLKWLDLVFADLERAGYSVGAADLCAAGVGAPHIRQRLYFVAVADGQRHQGVGLQLPERKARREVSEARGSSKVRLGDTSCARSQERSGSADGRGTVRHEGATASAPGAWDDVEWLACQDGKQRPAQPGIHPLAHGVTNRVGKLRAYGNALCAPVAITFVRAVMQALGF